MELTQFFNQKVKVTVMLFLVMGFIVLFSLRVDNRTTHMDEAVTSVYQDRLQPALIIVYLSENLHAKRMLLENHVNGPLDLAQTDIEAKLEEYNTKNNKLVADFEQTVLTRNEAAVLSEFKQDLANNARMEQVVLQRIKGDAGQSAAALYSSEGDLLFRQGIQNLHILAQIQSETGREIMQGSHRDAAGVSVITSLMIAVAVIIGILIQSLIQNARFQERGASRFQLNQSSPN